MEGTLPSHRIWVAFRGAVPENSVQSMYPDHAVPRPEDLPDYNRPPIDEVAIGVQFPIIPGFSEPHVGLYWQKIRPLYPRSESQPRIETPVEVLISPPPPIPPPGPFMFGPNAQSRSWLISEDDSFLVQLQNNRFVLNWRRRDNDYPHFDAILERFQREYATFIDLLTEEQLAPPDIEQLEVTYVNWIADDSMASFFRPAEASRIDVEGVSPEPEDQSWMARYLVSDGSGPIARLYAHCQPATRVVPPPASTGVQFAFIYRAPTVGRSDSRRLLHLITVGRETIVNAFTELTTEVGQETWDRFQ